MPPTFSFSARSVRAIAACVIVMPCVGIGAQGPQATYTFLAMRGADTLGTETVVLSDTDVIGVTAMRGQPRFEWRHERQGPSFGALTMRVSAPGAPAGAPPAQMAGVRIVGDSAVAEVRSGDKVVTQKMATKSSALALINASVVHQLLLASAARRAKASTFDVFLTGGGQTIAGTLQQRGDTLVVGLAGTELRALFAVDGLPTVIMTSQGVRMTRVAGLGPGAATTIGTINYNSPPNAPYTAEDVRIKSGRGYDLAATLTKPKGMAKVPVVITISGSGPQERDSRLAILPSYAFFREIADTLGRRGVAVLRFDDRGVGASGGRETAAKATSADFADDVRAIITWLRTRPDIDASRIVLAGHSEGGMIAPMVAATDPSLRGIALLAGPAYAGRRVSLMQNRFAVDAAPGLSRGQRDSIMATVPARLDSAGRATPWLGYWLSYDPVPTIRRVKQPVLVLHGLTDTQVSPEQADTLTSALRASGNHAVTLRTFPATNHLFLDDPSGAPSGYSALKNARIRRDVLGALADWVVKVVK